MVANRYTKADIMKMLSAIPDPEIPVVTIEEMGMLRDVEITDKGYNVLISPTYTGCPAMSLIDAEIKMVLKEHGAVPVTVTTVIQPVWTTDMLTDRAREKMRRYGIAPPAGPAATTSPHAPVACPRCESDDTVMVSRFGATACKALYTCNDCKEPFEYFKCH